MDESLENDGLQHPCISVIVPFYNAADHFDETLDSIAAQDFEDFEVLLIDDGSTDGSAEIARRRESVDERFHYVRQDNQGAGAARNRGMGLAKGSYLMFLDADDLFEYKFLSVMYHSAVEFGSEVTVCRADCFDSETRRSLGLYGSDKMQLVPGPHLPADYEARLFQTFLPVPWDKLYKADYVRNHHLEFQNLPYSNDNYFVTSAIAEATSICIVDEVLVHYRIGTGHSLRDGVSKNPFCDLLALDAIADRTFGRKPLNPVVITSFRTWCCIAVFNSARNLAIQDANAAKAFCEEYFSRYEERWGVNNLTYATSLSRGFLWRYRRLRGSSVKGFLWACGIGAEGRTKQANKSIAKKALFAACLTLSSLFTKSMARCKR